MSKDGLVPSQHRTQHVVEQEISAASEDTVTRQPSMQDTHGNQYLSGRLAPWRN